MSRPRRSHRQAFSLIEVMVSASLLLVGLAALFSSYSSITQLTAHNRHTDQGIHLAQQTAEELSALAGGRPHLSIGPHSGLTFDRQGIRSNISPFYTVSWVVSPWRLAGTIEIDVTTTWLEDGQDKRINLLMYREGP